MPRRQVTKSVRDRVDAKLRSCIAKAEKHYGITINFPTVLYTLRGTTAGTAAYWSWTVNLNSVLLMENVDEMINDTVPHELAHLIDYQLHPSNFESRVTVTRSGRVRRTKRSVHGPTWKSIMRVLGADPARCHNMDTSNAKVRKKAEHLYVCKTCGREMILGPKAHPKHQRSVAAGGKGYYLRGGCKHHAGFEYKGLKGQQSPTIMPLSDAASKSKPKAKPKRKKPKSTKSGTKLDRARSIYATMIADGKGRADIIAAFMSDLDMSKAGAQTYYYNCRKA